MKDKKEKKEKETKVEDGLVKEENVVMGTVGALIGSLAGVAAIVLLDRIGFVASIAGVIMGVATIYMYERLAGSISKKGIIISCVIMVGMVLLAANIAWSIAIAKELNAPFFEVFKVFYKIIGITSEIQTSYITGLLMLYGFTALGAFGVIKNKLNELKTK